MFPNNIISFNKTFLIAVAQPICHDEDPREKCLYLKDLGLCNEVSSHPYIKRRCSETCNLCELPPPPPQPCQEECQTTVCSGCAAAARKSFLL